MRKTIILLFSTVITVFLLAGCATKVNLVSEPKNIDELMEESALSSEPIEFNSAGEYVLTFHYDKGGFSDADMSKAYVAYYPSGIDDMVDVITGGETGDIPALPEDAASAYSASQGTDKLEKIAVIKVLTVDDKTLEVSFRDPDQPVNGRDYWFFIPNLNLAGSASTKR